MSESDLERELHRRGQDLMRKLLQGHLDQRRPAEAAGPVAGADGVERRERRVHKRAVETIFRTVDIDRVGYARPGHESLHPLDASLNLPVERYSLEVRRRVASRSFDEALSDLSDTGVVEGACRPLVRDRMELTGARWRLVGAEAVLKLRALRASGDFDAYWHFHEAREYERNHAQRYADGTVPSVAEPPPTLTPPSTGQVALVMLVAELHEPPGTADAKEPHPFENVARQRRQAHAGRAAATAALARSPAARVYREACHSPYPVPLNTTRRSPTFGDLLPGFWRSPTTQAIPAEAVHNPRKASSVPTPPPLPISPLPAQSV